MNVVLQVWVRRLVYMIIVLGVLIFLLIGPVDRTPLKKQQFYHSMMEKLDTTQLESYAATGPTRSAWAQFSIVPDHPVHLSGYGFREKFTSVHDSLYARIVAIDNGSMVVYFVTVDLLIFPPTLQELIYSKLGETDRSFLYFSASHTHTGVGGWDPSLLGRILMGEYESSWMDSVATRIVKDIHALADSLQPVKLSYFESDATTQVENRIDKASPRDGTLSGLKMTRSDGASAVLFSFSAHPTLLPGKNTAVSNDYPGEVIRRLNGSNDFGLFLAGPMASHRASKRPFEGYDFTSQLGQVLADSIAHASLETLPDSLTIKAKKIQVEFGASQLRIANDWKVRDWLFRKVAGPLKGNILVLQLGNVLMLGTSCDFSGEIIAEDHLRELAEEKGLKLMITSFNGYYTGYITADEHYDSSTNEEVRGLNWVGPYFGDYYSQIVNKIIDRTVAE